MIKIKNNKLNLLKVILDHVKDSLVNTEINPNVESEVTEMFDHIQDRKEVKQLKLIQKELIKWIKDMESEVKSS